MANQPNKKDSKGKGRGFFGDPDTHARAGRKGGEATARQHGPEFYSEIGQRGGEASSGSFSKKDPQRAREAGRKGGRARRSKSTDQTT